MHVPGTTLVLKNTIKFCSHAYGVKQFVTTEQCDTMTVDTLHFTINNALTRHSPETKYQYQNIIQIFKFEESYPPCVCQITNIRLLCPDCISIHI